MREQESFRPIRRKRRFDDDEPTPDDGVTPEPRRVDRPGSDQGPDQWPGGRADLDGPPTGDRWSTWEGATHGPLPRPGWVVTEHAAVDTELGVLKTGKEADVHLVERAVPGTDRVAVMAAKRYRTAEHRMFHRDAGYLEGRRVRRSREMRAMTHRTTFGRDLLSGQWAAAEFAALAALWSDGVAVPYPVQHTGTELLLEFLGDDDGHAAPRLAQLRPGTDEVVDLWHQLTRALTGLARRGLTHGDLSAYNLLVHHGRLVVIDLPQVVDVVGNPNGPGFLDRDVRRVGDWFVAHGLPPEVGQPATLLDALRIEVGITPG